MKKGVLNTIIVLAVIGMIAAWMMTTYNKLVTQEENVEQAWGQVENQYQRRFDLIPNLVAMYKEAARVEHDNYVDVVEARAKATQMNITPQNLTEENLAAFQNAQGELSQALGRLMVVIEKYPELKTNDNFIKVSDQLEGTENRITYARDIFNETAQTFNTTVRRFPGNIIAAICSALRKSPTSSRKPVPSVRRRLNLINRSL